MCFAGHAVGRAQGSFGLGLYISKFINKKVYNNKVSMTKLICNKVDT
jgi:hypothetical protein